MTVTADQPLISIDVVPVRFNRAGRTVDVILGRRVNDPAKGASALPGVLLLGAERLDDAVQRALETKIGVSAEEVLRTGEVGVFDNPDRDPRGPTLSITRFAVLTETAELGVDAVPTPIGSATGLPFDHDQITRVAAATLLDKLWADRDATVALLGREFTTLDAADLADSLAGPAGRPQVDRTNLSRFIVRTRWVEEVGRAAVAKQGRRPAVWRFR